MKPSKLAKVNLLLPALIHPGFGTPTSVAYLKKKTDQMKERKKDAAKKFGTSYRQVKDKVILGHCMFWVKERIYFPH